MWLVELWEVMTSGFWVWLGSIFLILAVGAITPGAGLINLNIRRIFGGKKDD